MLGNFAKKVYEIAVTVWSSERLNHNSGLILEAIYLGAIGPGNRLEVGSGIICALESRAGYLGGRASVGRGDAGTEAEKGLISEGVVVPGAPRTDMTRNIPDATTHRAVVNDFLVAAQI